MSGAAAHALAANGGLIRADGGAVILTAQAKDALLDTVVNNSGVIRAQTVADQNGTIQLLGGSEGTVNVAGTLDASAPNGGNGGTIETSGANLKVADGALITTKAASGSDGSWLIDPNDFTIAATGGDITGSALSTALGSGNVSIQTTLNAASCTGATCTTGTSGNGDIFVDDTVTWSAHTLALSAYRDIVINTQMNGSGTAGLALKYGQGSTNGVIGGVTSSYAVNAPVNLASTGSFSTQLGTSGSPVNYTIITSLGSSNSVTGTDLQGINGNLSGDYVLGADINASATSNYTWNSGAGFTPIGNSTTAFTGTFDGLGHTISGLNVFGSSADVGLFGKVGTNGTVREVGVLGGTISGGTDVGALAGINNGTISDAYSSDANSRAGVLGSASVGGLVGLNNGTIGEAYATGTVIGDGTNSSNVGNVGGLVGYNSGTVSNAYATGTVNSYTKIAGGLVGYNGGTISNAYATDSVSGSSIVGGLVGSNAGKVSSAYWDTTTTGKGTNAGFGVRGGTVTGGGGVNTAALAGALPTGFSSTVWGNGGSKTTPYLLANASFGTVSGQVILGSDTSATPTYYGVILNVTQLQAMGLSGNYVLGTNIDASATASWNPNGSGGYYGFAPAGNSYPYFSGTFDGLGHTISGLTINRPTSYNVGLFAKLNGGTIQNVGLVGGSSNGATISNAYATGSVNGTGYVGGLVGQNSTGTITDAYATGNVSGSGSVGGLVGSNSGTIPGTISTNVYATGSVSGSSSAGGLVGNNSGTITDAYATGSVSGSSNEAGGLVGYNGGTVSNAYAIGKVTGGNGVGGLVGNNSNGTITGAYATGSVSGVRGVGGLVGSNSGTISGTISTNVYATGSVSGTYDGGLVGFASNATISSVHATGGVSVITLSSNGTASAGGLVGTAGSSNGATISNAYATGSVSGGTSVGGLVGSNPATGTISNSYATGSVGGTGYYGLGGLGGLVGNNNGTISNAYATGSVSGGSNDGGLVGNNSNGTITDAYATGTVYNFGGALVGKNSSGTISNGYWDTATAGVSVAVGYGSGTVTGGAGLSAAQMLQQSSFTGFDFTTTPVWVIYTGHTAPLLNAFLTPLTVTSSNQTQTYTGSPSTLTLSKPSYSVTGAATSGHLDGLSAPYSGAVNVGTYSPDLWSDQQGYRISYVGGTLTIKALAVTLTAPSVTKTYDGTTGYTTTATDLSTLASPLVGGDTVTAATITYANKNAGISNKSVSLSGVAISDGNGGANYSVTLAGNSTSTIDPLAVTLTAPSVTKTYDGTTGYTATASDLSTLASPLVGGDAVTAATIAYANKNASANKTVNLNAVTINDGNGGANYSVTLVGNSTSTIDPLAVTLTAPSVTKTYDGTIGYTATASDLSALSGPLAGGDVVTGATITYANQNVGSNKTVTLDAATINDGNNGNNYTVSLVGNATSAIDPLSVVLTGSRTYDGTALIEGALLSAGNEIAGDSLSISGSGTLAGKGPGDEAIIDFSGLALSNADYTLTGASGDVTVVPVGQSPRSGLSVNGGSLTPDSGSSPLLNPFLASSGGGASGTPGTVPVSTRDGGVNAPDAACRGQGGINPFAAPGSGSILCGGG